MVAEMVANPVDMQVHLSTDAEEKILSKLALNAELRNQQKMCQENDLTDESCEHILPPVGALLAGAKWAETLVKREALRKISMPLQLDH